MFQKYYKNVTIFLFWWADLRLFFMKYWNVHPYGLASLRMTEWNDGTLKMVNGNTMVNKQE